MERYSYSKLDVFDQCPFRYEKTYIEKLRSEESTIALDMGSTCHKGKEMWGEALINRKKPDYNDILDVVQNGREYWKINIFNGVEVENKLYENILGIEEIKSKYFEEFNDICNKSGLTYNEKLNIYLNNLKDKELEDGWKVLQVEMPFEFIYDDRCVLNGKIDRVDINENKDIRVADYKTSKDIYKSDKLATPLQMFIYGLACEKIFGKLPIEYKYDFILLGQEQEACTKGYYNRGLKKLNKLLDSIDECVVKNEFKPKPSPLCAFCPYSGQSYFKDSALNGLCDYYCLWTREKPRFDVNKRWGDFSNNKAEKKRDFVW